MKSDSVTRFRSQGKAPEPNVVGCGGDSRGDRKSVRRHYANLPASKETRSFYAPDTEPSLELGGPSATYQWAGTLIGSVGFASAMVGQGFNLNGSGYVQVPASGSLDLTNEFTLETWYKDLGSPAGFHSLIAKRSVDPAPYPPSGVFHHLAVSFRQADATQVELKLFIDGQGAGPLRGNEIFTFSGLNKPIPDGNPAGVADFETISSSITQIGSIQVGLNISGNFNGDLYCYLRHSNSLSVLA